jgi:hypothetical protein
MGRVPTSCVGTLSISFYTRGTAFSSTFSYCVSISSDSRQLLARSHLTSGITAEPVAWIDAPFDLLATLFLLLAILELLHWTQSGRWIHLTVGCALVAVACCTKESAFLRSLAHRRNCLVEVRRGT